MTICCEILGDARPVYGQHTVFMEERPYVIYCHGPSCLVCRGAVTGVNWKEVDRMIKKIFGVVNVQGA